MDYDRVFAAYKMWMAVEAEDLGQLRMVLSLGPGADPAPPASYDTVDAALSIVAQWTRFIGRQVGALTKTYNFGHQAGLPAAEAGGRAANWAKYIIDWHASGIAPDLKAFLRREGGSPKPVPMHEYPPGPYPRGKDSLEDAIRSLPQMADDLDRICYKKRAPSPDFPPEIEPTNDSLEDSFEMIDRWTHKIQIDMKTISLKCVENSHAQLRVEKYSGLRKKTRKRKIGAR